MNTISDERLKDLIKESKVRSINPAIINCLLELQTLRQKLGDGRLVEVDCDGCQNNFLHSVREWDSCDCASCARQMYEEYPDKFTREAAEKEIASGYME